MTLKSKCIQYITWKQHQKAMERRMINIKLKIRKNRSSGKIQTENWRPWNNERKGGRAQI